MKKNKKKQEVLLTKKIQKTIKKEIKCFWKWVKTKWIEDKGIYGNGETLKELRRK